MRKKIRRISVISYIGETFCIISNEKFAGAVWLICIVLIWARTILISFSEILEIIIRLSIGTF